MSITYLHDTNLSVKLTAPNGTTIPLFAGVGGQGANFGGPGQYTIFSDSGPVGIASGTRAVLAQHPAADGGDHDLPALLAALGPRRAWR